MPFCISPLKAQLPMEREPIHAQPDEAKAEQHENKESESALRDELVVGLIGVRLGRHCLSLQSSGQSEEQI